jgi:hypothetical protein
MVVRFAHWLGDIRYALLRVLDALRPKSERARALGRALMRKHVPSLNSAAQREMVLGLQSRGYRAHDIALMTGLTASRVWRMMGEPR